MGQSTEPMLHRVSLTTARDLSPLFDEAVRREQPVVIVRDGRERAVLLSRDQQLRLLAPFRVQVDVIPEDEDGGFTLWVRELGIGEHGSTLAEARRALIEGVRSYVRYFFQRWDSFRHLTDKAAQEPYVYRLSLAQDDDELVTMLFGPPAGQDDDVPGTVAAGTPGAGTGAPS